MEPVRELDDDDPRILGDGQQQLPIILDLLFGRRAEGEVRDLGQAFNDGGDLGTELAGDVFCAHIRVFHDIVQQGGGNGC